MRVLPGMVCSQVLLVAQSEDVTSLLNCKDKFLVQSLPLEKGQDATQDLFKSRLPGLQEVKLPVTVVSGHQVTTCNC